MTAQPAARVRATPERRRPAGRGLRRVEEIAAPAPARARLADLLGPAAAGSPATELAGHGDGSRVRVITTAQAHHALRPAAFPRHVEAGGFLIGHRHADADRPGSDLLVVTDVVAAAGVGSRHAFRFPAESFLHVASVIGRRGPGTLLLGWYHTHVTPISGGGLSRTDVSLHRCTFRLPWQVAALIELGRARVPLRIFYFDDGDPREAPVWTLRP